MREFNTQTAVILGSLLISFSIISHALLLRINTDGIMLPRVLGTTTTTAKPTTVKEAFTNYAVDAKLNKKQFETCFDSKKYSSEVQTDASEGSTAGVDGTPTTFINGIAIRGAQPYAEFKRIIDNELTGAPTYARDPETGQETTELAPRVQVAAGNNPRLGDASAKISIIEYSDFECPFCKRMYDDAFKKLKQEYIATGKATLVFRHMPLPFHKYAEDAANASECANEQGKFWQYHDVLFEKQNDWAKI